MSRPPVRGSQTLSSQISAYLNEKYIDFKIGHLGMGNGVRVIFDDIPEKMWKGLIGPELVRMAKDRSLRVSAAHCGSHTDDGINLEVILSTWELMDFARQGWVLVDPDLEEIDYYTTKMG